MMISKASLDLALCNAAVNTISAQGIALQAEGGAPEWVQLLPNGPVITGRDGRAWKNPDPQLVINAFTLNKGPLPIDWEHGQYHLAPKGQAAPAAGWIEAMEIRNGEIWGKVSWVPRAINAITTREYRFLSPAFTHALDGTILKLVGAGLVNQPNLVMTALNGELHVDKTLAAVLAALGIAPTTSEADILVSVNALKTKAETALNSQLPSLDKYVPRADFEIALNRARIAEETIAADKKAQKESEITAVVEDALKAGKIVPSSKDFYLATCRAEGGLEHFKTFVAAQPSMFSSAIDPSKKPGEQTALNADERKVVATLGLTEAEYLAAKKSDAA